MVTWLMVAAEAREFGGILKRAGEIRPLAWPSAAFSREAAWKNSRWLLIANGPGPRLVERALDRKNNGKHTGEHNGKPDVDRILSIGFCGALDPALRIGDIVVSGEVPKGLRASFVRGEVVSVDRVAITVREKCDFARPLGRRWSRWSPRQSPERRGNGMCPLAVSAPYPTPRERICRWISIGIVMRTGASSAHASRWRPWGVHSPCCPGWFAWISIAARLRNG